MTNRILHSGTSLGRSMLWEYQRRYYAHAGPVAWKKVPYNITSNMFIANQYAYWAALALQDQIEQKVLNTNKPVYFLELGTGHGRFGAYFTQKLDVWLGRMGLRERVSYVYVLSDSARGNVDFWKQHPYWKKRIEEGSADTSRFDVENQKTVFLEHANTFLTDLENPLFVVANYLFDTISHDVFSVRNGDLWECETTVTTSDPQFNEEIPEALDSLKVSCIPVRKNNAPYENTVWNTVLGGLAQGIADGSVLFPSGSLQVLENLQKLAPKGTVLFVGDKGHASIAPMKGAGLPNMAAHGSFSWMVNFPALAAWVSLHQGSAAVKQQGGSFVVAACAYGCALGHQWHQVLEDVSHTFGADDFFILKRDIQKHVSHFKPDALLASLRLSAYDPDHFVALSQAWVDQTEETWSVRDALLTALEYVEKGYYSMPASKDCLIELGRIYHLFEKYDEAVRLYKKSIHHFGESWAIYFNLGLCAYAQQNTEEALRCWKKAVSIDPSQEVTQEYVHKLEQGLALF